MNFAVHKVILARISREFPIDARITGLFIALCFGDWLANYVLGEEVLMAAEAAQHAQNEFWRPPMQTAIDATALSETGRLDTCDRCGTEFIVGSRFCHSCGNGREGTLQAAIWREKVAIAKFASLADGLDLSTPAFISFLIGIGCVLAAAAVGVVFSTQRVIDWQAVQLWRIEWLLGAVAAFVAGCLLKKAR